MSTPNENISFAVIAAVVTAVVSLVIVYAIFKSSCGCVSSRIKLEDKPDSKSDSKSDSKTDVPPKQVISTKSLASNFQVKDLKPIAQTLPVKEKFTFLPSMAGPLVAEKPKLMMGIQKQGANPFIGYQAPQLTGGVSTPVSYTRNELLGVGAEQLSKANVNVLETIL